MSPIKVNLKEKLSKFSEQWSPKIVAQMNETHFKLVKVQGEFVWHKHDETDEVFLVLEGVLDIEMREETVRLEAGEMVVVPMGMEHKPVAKEECHLLVIEPAGTVNRGDAGGEGATAGEWI